MDLMFAWKGGGVREVGRWGGGREERANSDDGAISLASFNPYSTVNQPFLLTLIKKGCLFRKRVGEYELNMQCVPCFPVSRKPNIVYCK